MAEIEKLKIKELASGNGEKTKLLPPPPEPAKWDVQRLLRLLSALLFAIIGYNLAGSDFFYNYPLFGVNYLAKILITPLFALGGYFVIFELLIQLRRWLEKLIINTVVDIVSRFWDLQSRKIQEQRRIKQKAKSDLAQAQLEEDYKNAVVLDTSILIDGRVVEIVKLGFLDVPFIVGQEIINELHLLSDNKDRLKRQKGRRGLDTIKDLKKLSKVHIKSIKNGNGTFEVDKLLVEYCGETGFKLATMDFNLSKVASVNNIKVLNINALANSIKTVLLPGEEVVIKVVQEGREKKQGIGYLDDGTMIVIENAKDKVGQEIKVNVVKVIQSPAGRMVFCNISKTE